MPDISATTALRALGWAHVLANMGNARDRTYRFSSVYGHRNYPAGTFATHNGIDVVDRLTGSDGILGVRVNSPFAGRVEHIYTNNSDAGHGIVIEYTVDGVQYFVRHLHLQLPPARANGIPLGRNDRVAHGEHVGRVGGTPRFAVHLHTDVHRNFNPIGGGDFSRSIDPRAFYADNYSLIAPWPNLNIRN
jgi:hypothetical protein